MNRSSDEVDRDLYVLEEAIKSLMGRIDKLEQQIGLKIKVDEIEPIYSHTETGLFCASHKEPMRKHKKQLDCYIVFGNFERVWLPEEEISKLLKEQE